MANEGGSPKGSVQKPSDAVIKWKDEDTAALLQVASQRARDSLAEADELLAQGFANEALVWAVRSVEIFTKEFLLAPLYLAQTHGNWGKAVKRAAKLFGPSNWDGAYAELEKHCGPLDQMLVEDGSDAWTHWRSSVVRWRGDIVHGRFGSDVTADEAAQAIAYAEQLIKQLKMRMIVKSAHPFSTMFFDMYSQAFDAYWGEGEYEKRHAAKTAGEAATPDH